MPILHLIRHGKAAAGWGDDADPGLDAEGSRQAEAAAELLASLGPLALATSPLRRARETASALERRWARAAVIDQAIAEIPSPVADLGKRATWLTDVMQGRWTALEPALQAWRTQLVAALLRYPGDTVLFTHFIAINVAVGQALGDDRVVCFRPEYCSCTVLDTAGSVLRLVRRGQEAATRVL
jgi:broad specificity phosphatase PhoE